VHCKNWASVQVLGLVAAATTAICILDLGSDFLLVMVGIFYHSWLSLFGALALVGYWFSSEIILCQG
jgi:hypothetical protein